MGVSGPHAVDWGAGGGRRAELPTRCHVSGSSASLSWSPRPLTPSFLLLGCGERSDFAITLSFHRYQLSQIPPQNKGRPQPLSDLRLRCPNPDCPCENCPPSSPSLVWVLRLETVLLPRKATKSRAHPVLGVNQPGLSRHPQWLWKVVLKTGERKPSASGSCSFPRCPSTADGRSGRRGGRSGGVQEQETL